MTPDEADHLGKRIINSFRGGPPLTDWREVLEPLDAGKAGTAYMRLRTNTDSPTIKRFMDEYRALNTDRPVTFVCGECDNTGWVQAEDRIEHPGTDHERHYTQNRPCRCAEGKQRERSAVWRERGGDQRTDHAA